MAAAEGTATWLIVLENCVLPIVTLILGWFGNVWRNKQKKEQDILSNVQQILNIQKDYIAEQQSTLQDAKNVNKRLEAKLDKKDRAIRKANGCKWTNDGDGCPVLGEVDRLEDHYVTDCEHCKYHQEEKPESEEKQ